MITRSCSLLSLLVAAVALPTAASAYLTNTSSRGWVDDGENVLITGFIVQAEPGELRWILVRGTGPSLADLGVTSPVADPAIAVYDANGNVVGSNASAGEAANGELMATVVGLVGAFPQTSALDAAALIGLPRGAYSAILRGEGGSSGVGLIEVYEAGAVDGTAPAQTLSGLAAVTPNLSTLATALRRTGLDVVLSQDGPFTVFAPTNEAFAALPEGTLEALLAAPEQLAEVLLNHVVAGRVLSGDLTDGQQVAPLLDGADPLTISLGETVQVNDATVVAADIEAVNGVVHVIDQVLVP